MYVTCRQRRLFIFGCMPQPPEGCDTQLTPPGNGNATHHAAAGAESICGEIRQRLCVAQAFALSIEVCVVWKIVRRCKEGES